MPDAFKKIPQIALDENPSAQALADHDLYVLFESWGKLASAIGAAPEE